MPFMFFDSFLKKQALPFHDTVFASANPMFCLNQQGKLHILEVTSVQSPKNMPLMIVPKTNGRALLRTCATATWDFHRNEDLLARSSTFISRNLKPAMSPSKSGWTQTAQSHAQILEKQQAKRPTSKRIFFQQIAFASFQEHRFLPWLPWGPAPQAKSPGVRFSPL